VSATVEPSPPSPSWLRWLAPAIPVAAAFGLALTRIGDPDAFTHLALGRDLVERGGFPAHEPFSFPSADRPYYNSEWLFDVVFYAASRAGGTAAVVLLKAALAALAAWILWLDSRAWRQPQSERSLGLLIRSAVLTATVLMLSHRFVERPDLALMIFLSFTIYALNAYIEGGRRLIFLLPLVWVVWANVHPSVIVGLMPFAAVLGGGLALRIGVLLIARWWQPTAATIPSWRQLATVAGVLVGVVVATIVNPYRLDPLTLPFRLADMPWFRQEILELQPPSPSAWPGPYVMTALLALGLVRLVAHLPLVPGLLVLPFVRLGLSAVRFVFLLELVAAPILARTLVTITAVAVTRPLTRRLVRAGAALAMAIAVVAVVSAAVGVGPFADTRRTAGLGVNERWVPEGALRYLDARAIDGRMFNAFHFGGYITWRDFPRRVPIVDGRGHLPPSLLEEIHFARAYPRHLQAVQARFGLEVAVMDYPTYSGDSVAEVLGPDADAALASPEWALVYWDDVALVYLRRGGAHAGVIARDEYQAVKPANGAAGIMRMLGDAASAERLRGELARNVMQTHSSLGLLLQGYAAADPDQAIAAFERVRDPARRFEADQATATVYWRRKDYARATAYYDRALAREPAAPVLYNAGLMRAEAGDDRGAIAYLTRAQRADPDLAPVYAALVAAHRRLGNEAAAADLGPAFLRAATRARVADHESAARRLLAEGRLADADAQLRAALQLDGRSVVALTTLGYVRLAERRFDDAVRAEEQALAIDPRDARAHWALAQIARARGDESAARQHFQVFARLSPRSYEAWQIRSAP
jgi:tetratricopeptide (TPR) repeat protein